MDILAVIPARGGSKGIRRKNLRLLGGKPLIYYQIQNALQSKYITDVVITSDDEDILEYASNFPVYLRKRPPELALDNITLDPVIWDATIYMENMLNKQYDVVVTLQPTSPLLKPKTLDRAIEKFISENLDTLVPVIDATHLYWKEEGTKIVPDYKERLNRQWLPKKYKETGAFLITKREFITKDSRFGRNIGIFILDEIEGLDIDTPIDWLIAETFLRRLKILFVVNGNEKIGMGHIYRTLTLADRFIGHEVLFLTYESNEQAIKVIHDAGYQVIVTSKDNLIKRIAEIHPDIVINDILDTDFGYIKKLKELGVFVVNFEDLGEGADEAHLVFNALYEKTNPNPNHRFGYEYECLNEKFYLYSPIEFRDPPKTLFISFGGVDQNNLTCKVLQLVPEIFSETSIERVITVIGPGYSHKAELITLLNRLNTWKEHIEVHQNVKNMPRLMRRADIAITSNGRTIYELTAMGIPTISIAQNDRETLHLFARYHRGIKYLGIACTVNQEDILNTIKEIANDSYLRKRMYLAQIEASKVIRQGINRVINEILSEYWRWKNERDQAW
ncbi:glycosyltransferase [Pyrococcus kukulkanii]|uniref:cytidylyltransferase domain-containing protein n=1 Tax=Pyrococcus kukulkanii TaxID=1609559 RepID=UPI003561E37D